MWDTGYVFPLRRSEVVNLALLYVMLLVLSIWYLIFEIIGTDTGNFSPLDRNYLLSWPNYLSPPFRVFETKLLLGACYCIINVLKQRVI